MLLLQETSNAPNGPVARAGRQNGQNLFFVAIDNSAVDLLTDFRIRCLPQIILAIS